MANIALVVLDTLRKDAFEEYFNWLPGKYYNNAWSTSHWTVPVHGSMFTGKYPSEIGIHSGRRSFDIDDKALAEELSSNDYTTRAFSCNVNISPTYCYDRGFHQFELLGYQQDITSEITYHNKDIYNWNEFMHEYPHSKYGNLRYIKAIRECISSNCNTFHSLLYGIKLKFNQNPGNKDRDMGSKSVLNKIDNTKFGDNEFLFLNLMEAHSPYQIPDEYKDVDNYETPRHPVNKVISEDLSAVKTIYYNSANYLSDIYEKIFDLLNKDFDYIITVSDHGELLGEHGFYEHAFGLFPELTNIPIHVHGPDVESGTDSQLSSLLDVHQTILDIAGVDSFSRGENLLKKPGNSEYLVEYHGLTYPSKKIKQMENWGLSEDEIDQYMQPLNGICISENYYGYETLEEGFIEKGNATVRNPQERMQELLASLDKKKPDQKHEPIPESLESRLEDLGYIN